MKAQRLMSRFLPACAALLLAGAGAQAQTNGAAPPQPPNGTSPTPPLKSPPTGLNDPVPSNGVVKPPPIGDREIQQPAPSPGPNSMPVVPPPSNTVPK